MPCMHPFPAWRQRSKITSAGDILPGALTFNRLHQDGNELQIPCGTCMGCNKSKAQGWALRCLLELQEHDTATFTTLTFNDQKLPLTLRRRDIQLFVKRLRKRQPAARPLRHFSCGEYGETTQRPHYHSILFGCNAEVDAKRIEAAWGMGHTYTVPVTPAAIGYTAGYCAKKYNDYKYTREIRTDYQTGEEYQWQPPFIQMSRGGRTGTGIAGKARTKYTQSWKDYGILNGTRIPVPKYLHKQWEEITNESEKEEHAHEKYLRTLTKERMTEYHLEAQEQIAIAQQKLQGERRKL